MAEIKESTKFFVGGLIAGEGCFASNGKRFDVRVHVAADDPFLVETVKNCLGCGKIYSYKSRKPTEKASLRWTVQSVPVLVEKVVPFMDKYLVTTRKKDQYLKWRSGLLERHKEMTAPKPIVLCLDCGSDKIRARSYCGSHYESRRRRGEFSGE